MSAMRVHIDYFTSWDDLPKRDQRDDAAVLAFLPRARWRASVWDPTPVLMTLTRLVKLGRLREVESAYPWMRYAPIDPAVTP